MSTTFLICSLLSLETFLWVDYVGFEITALCTGLYISINPSFYRWIVISLLVKVSRFKLFLQLNLLVCNILVPKRLKNKNFHMIQLFKDKAYMV